MNLVIVESPTKAKKLTGYLGKDYVVRASVGHVRDLPKKELGVDLENNFEPKYVTDRKKADVVKELKNLSQKAGIIYLATDPDREGEAIAWHIKYLLGDKKDYQRATFHEITHEAVLAAIAHPSKINENLVNAQQARRVVDRLVGYKVSPVIWKKVRWGLSAGRVQSVALRLIVEREREIAAFKAEEYWELDVLLSLAANFKLAKDKAWLKELPANMLPARVFEVDQQKYLPQKESDVTGVVKFLEHADYVVESIESKERSRASFPPFTTSTLQQAAANKLGFTSKQTMTLAQQLYEEGLITYHRTDSMALSAQALDMARDYIGRNYGANYLPEKTRVFKNKSKNAQEAHEAIRVTQAELLPSEIQSKSSKFTPRHVKLYDLIWRKFLASQMKAAIYDQTSVLVLAWDTKKATARLKATGSVLKFDGWMKLFPNSGDTILPALSNEQKLYFADLNAAQKFTQPPARYNDASLVKELEKRGIGRPSTYASIISVIEERGYVNRDQKRFIATPIGMTVSDFLLKYFPKIMDYDFTAAMEEDLDRIARGEKEWRKIVGDFYWPLEKKIKEVDKEAGRMQIPVEKTGEPCPLCHKENQGEIVIRTGKFGKFKSCSRYPDCKFTENIVEKVADVLCPLCQKGEVIFKNTRWGKKFFGCSRYPDCDWASWKQPEKGEQLTTAQWVELKQKRAERIAKRKERFAKKK